MTPDLAATPVAPWGGSLPGDWRLTRIDDVADVFFSNVDKHTLDDEEPVRLCNYVDVYNNDRITRALDFMEASAEPREIKKFQIQRGDVLSTKDSETPDDIAVSALVDDDLPGVLCGYHLAMMRPRSNQLHGPFLAWAHASKPFRAQYEARAVGVTRFGLPQYAFRSGRLPLPPIGEQEGIAAYLDASCAAIDAAVAAKRRQIEVLDALRSSILSTTLTSGIGDVADARGTGSSVVPRIPREWTLKRLKSVAKVRYGLGQPPAQLASGVEMIRATDLHAGHISVDHLMRVDPQDLPVERNPYLKSGEIIVVRSGAYTGDSAIVPPELEGCIAGYDMVVTVDRASSRFVAYCLLSRYVLEDQILLMTLRAAQPHLNAEQLGSVVLAVPPQRSEQDAIVAFLDRRLGEVAKVSHVIRRQIDALVSYRTSLIHECVTGQRRVTKADVKRAQGHG